MLTGQAMFSPTDCPRRVTPNLGNVHWAVADLCFAENGQSCPSCEQPLTSLHGIEVGHTFYLGTKYSLRLSAVVKDGKKATPIEMGCFVIGVSRILAVLGFVKAEAI
ncbi:hypothetical protein BJ742DRAFT_779043 [Cladochytrium replicatum]|nr:hypothetical protein BJ742DRAFT_779043 [Cladochytrium replicatum]